MDGARSILMVGCGAMGGIFAERLSHVAPVTAYDTDAEHVAAIRAGGLRVTAGGEERTGAGRRPSPIRPNSPGAASTPPSSW